jgi:hypothetical protein
MRKKYTTDIYIDECKSIHNDVYDYSMVVYNGFKNKVSIICKKHGFFTQRAQAHLDGQKCSHCYSESRNITKDEFINKSKEIHNDKYIYSDFLSLKKRVSILCKKHGFFTQMPYRHLKGQGCDMCSRESHRISQSDFIERSTKIHKGVYDYSNVKYINHSTKVDIICKKHGPFKQTPNNHMIHRKGCIKCSKMISKMETDWLDKLGIDNRQHRIIIENKTYIVDAFDSSNRIIYEFYGDYWHGNPNIYNLELINKVNNKSFGQLYKETLDREKTFDRNGYKVISIWEDEFKKMIKK